MIPTHKHYKGELYMLMGVAIRESDLEAMAVYVDKDEIWWVRPLSEFHEKFIALEQEKS